MNNNFPQSDIPFDEFVVEESMIRSVIYGDDLSEVQRNNPDAEYVKDLRELDDVLKEQGHQAIAELWTPFDFGFDYERGDKDNRNRLEEAIAQIEKVLAEEINVPQIILLCSKRGGDIFPHLDIVKQLKEKIETPSNQR